MRYWTCFVCFSWIFLLWADSRVEWLSENFKRYYDNWLFKEETKWPLTLCSVNIGRRKSTQKVLLWSIWEKWRIRLFYMVRPKSPIVVHDAFSSSRAFACSPLQPCLSPAVHSWLSPPVVVLLTTPWPPLYIREARWSSPAPNHETLTRLPPLPH
jgi:hypothetical protein